MRKHIPGTNCAEFVFSYVCFQRQCRSADQDPLAHVRSSHHVDRLQVLNRTCLSTGHRTDGPDPYRSWYWASHSQWS
eukprot:3716440-Rhodomonas_salina.1